MEFLAQAHEIQQQSTRTAEKHLAKEYGINSLSILTSLSSLAFPLSFSYDFMHLLWENVIPNLILLWTGQYKGVDAGTEDYEIDEAVWRAIGAATSRSSSTIPSAYGPRLPNIHDERHYYTADMTSFWTIYLGPILLHRRFHHAKYYKHFIKLVAILNKCLQFEHSTEDIEFIRTGFIE